MKKNFNKNSKSNKRAKYDSKSKKNIDEMEESDSSRSSSRKDRGNNDVNWYFSSSEQLRNVASYPFSNALMRDISIDLNGEATISSLTPGICRIDLVPTIGSDYQLGYSESSQFELNGSDAINVAAKSLYSFIRHANSGHTNYDSPDLMMYLLAMDSLYMLYSHLVRMYGVINLFQYNNRWYPDRILQSMGVKNPEYLRAHAADFRALINNFGIRLSSFAVPTVMPYFSRHLWLYQNLFLDRKSGKAQTFYFHPATFYEYVENMGKGELVPHTMENFVSNNPLDEISKYVNRLLSPIVDSEDIGIMSGDILKAFGPGKLYAFTPIPEFYTVLPTYHEGVLPEIHNAVSNGNVYNPATYTGLPVDSIRQTDDGFIYQSFAPMICTDVTVEDQHLAAVAPREWMIEIPYDSISPEDFVYATRLVALRDLSSGSGKHHSPITGSEMVVGISILNWEGWSGTAPSLTLVRQFEERSKVSMATLQSTAFDWFPRIYLYDVVAGTEPNTFNLTGGQAIEDINNFTVINGRDLKKLNHSIMYNMFGVPQSLTNA